MSLISRSATPTTPFGGFGFRIETTGTNPGPVRLSGERLFNSTRGSTTVSGDLKDCQQLLWQALPKQETRRDTQRTHFIAIHARACIAMKLTRASI